MTLSTTPSPEVITALASIFGASKGGSSFSNVAAAGADYVFVNVVNGSEFNESINPEPATFSLMGLGLAAVGFLGRRKLRRG